MIPSSTAEVLATVQEALTKGTSPARESRVLEIGKLTGLRHDGGRYRKANFERGLVVDALVSALHPKKILELGTGRGLGAFTMARAARESGLTPEILTLDVIPPATAQDWPIERNGKQEVILASRDEIWKHHLPESERSMISEQLGPTTSLLPALLKSGKHFDLIFIDAGHDLFSVVHDFCYAAKLLAPGGWILMDDFAPSAPYGLATCIVSTHARRFFQTVEILVTEGRIFGDVEIASNPRGMLLLGERLHDPSISPLRLAFWRLAKILLELCYRESLFPARSGN